MTREEAIEVLKQQARFLENDFSVHINLDKALAVAIKALEQQPCDDMVSRGLFEQVKWERDVAIEQLKELGYELGQKIEPCEDCISRQAVLDGINQLKKSPWATDKRAFGYEYLITEALEVVADLCVKREPSVTPKLKTEWIPVSERLPDFNDIVLASTDSDYDELRVILTVYSGEEFWFNGKIKAWMSLPEPYKVESEDKE